MNEVTTDRLRPSPSISPSASISDRPPAPRGDSKMAPFEEEKSEDVKAPLCSSDLNSSGESSGSIYKPVHREDWPLLQGKKNGYGTYGNWGREEGITLTWHDLTVYVKEKKRLRRGHDQRSPAKEILQNVSGTVSPGSLTAVLGASGAGKSTLMNALSHRTEGSMVVDGDILVNGCLLTRSIALLSGYMQQHNLFLGTLTAKEHLTFMARLRMDCNSTPRQREERVKELLTDLGLTKVQNTRIGVPGTAKSLSGGERRRLAFATEIINDPQLLFCDEPTTGLDSYNAEVIVKILKGMAMRGKTILCTIHQPSSEVFRMFDRLLLLAEGRLAYMGHSAHALQFWESLGHKCPSTFNPADYYIHTLAVLPGHETHSRERIKKICDNFAMSTYRKDIDISIQYQDNMQCCTTYEEESLFRNIPEKPGWLVQWWWLTWRSLLDARRNPNLHTFNVIRKVVSALLLAMCFSNIHLDQAGIQNIQGLLFSLITQACNPVFFGIVEVIYQELPLFFQEYKDGIYRCDAFYFSKMVALMPGLLVETVVFCVISYWVIGLQPHTYQFTMMLFIILFATITASSCALMLSAMTEKFDIIMLVTVPIHIVNVLSSGLFVNLRTMSWLTSWVKYLTWIMYGQEVLTVTQWSDVKNITCELPAGAPCISTGLEVIEKYAYQPSHLSFDFWWLVVVYCFYHAIGFISLYLRAKRK